MSCSNPSFERVYTPDKRRFYTGMYVKRPCRWCLNCRIDKRNYWEDRLNYERLRMKSSAFVTFTYDDYRIPLNSHGVPSLRRKDFTRFIDRLQRQLNYHGLPDFCFSDWSYYAVGEYGDQFGRPH